MNKSALIVLSASLVSAVAGYQFAAALYGQDIADLREDYATRAAALEVKYRERDQENARAVVAAWEERDRAKALAADLSGDLERVRMEADAARRELSRTSDDPCNAYKEKLARSTEIIERGADVVARCVRFSSELAADKDAVVRMVQSEP